MILKPREVVMRVQSGAGIHHYNRRRHHPMRGKGLPLLIPAGGALLKAAAVPLLKHIAVGAAGRAFRGLANAPKVAKEDRKDYAKHVVKDILRPSNLILGPLASVATGGLSKSLGLTK